jgi:hypothetical protein
MGKICRRLAQSRLNPVRERVYIKKFDIDATFAADIIPRGCEVRQAWQSRLGVLNAKYQKGA